MSREEQRAAQAERRREIAEAYDAGATMDVVAERFGVTRQRVQQVTSREGVKSHTIARPPVSTLCPVCGQTFERPDWKRVQKFCSIACSAWGRRKPDAPRGRLAYELRLSGLKWHEVKRVLDGDLTIGDGRGVCSRARDYALPRGLPWPIGIDHRRKVDELTRSGFYP